MSETHERFLASLDVSQRAVWHVAQWLQANGHTVMVPPLSKAPQHKDWRQHADGGDLFISQRVEIKHLSVNFTCQVDWPFREKYIVCAQHSYDMAKPKPFAYVHLSSNMEFAGIVKTDSFPMWTVEHKTDSRYNRSQPCYVAPIDVVRFIKLK